MKSYFFQIAVKNLEQNLDNNSVVIDGYASTSDIDRYRDIVEPTAFKDALEMYMQNPVMLRSHDPDRPIGNVLSATVTDKGLKIRAEIQDEQTKAEILDGRMRAMSIGYIPLESTLQHEDGTPFNAEKDSVWDPELIRVIKKLDLVEISIVSTPANGNALFTLAKSVKSYFNEVVTKSFMNKKDVQVNEVPAEEPQVPETVEPTAEKPVEPEQPQPTKPQNEDENVDESSTPETTEGETPEAVDTESKSEEEGEELPVSPDEAKSLTILGKLGLVREVKEAKTLDPKVIAVLAKMGDMLTVAAEEIKRLETQLEDTPAKKALVYKDEEEKVEKQTEPSPWFKSLFNLK